MRNLGWEIKTSFQPWISVLPLIYNLQASAQPAFGLDQLFPDEAIDLVLEVMVRLESFGLAETSYFDAPKSNLYLTEAGLDWLNRHNEPPPEFGASSSADPT